jgi:predicted membrane channel-forming protein YqfA (hemolysin III family)
MSFELGIVGGMTVICFIFAYFCVKEENLLFKWFYLIMSFSFMTATLDIMRKIAIAESMGAGITGGFETLVLVMISFIFLLIAIFFLFILKNAFDTWNPKKTAFKDMNPIGD